MKDRSSNMNWKRNFEKTLFESSDDELQQLKLWLFRENIRINSEKQEMQLLDQKIQFEKKRLSEDQIFFQKKLSILENAYKQLDIDRRKVEKDRKDLEHDRRNIEEKRVTHGIAKDSIYFKGVNSPLALKKRYKDLIKIFHPDNLCGDTGTIQMINKEYEMLKEVIKKDYP